MVSHLQPTNENYPVAPDILTRRYENRRVLIDRFVDIILGLPQIDIRSNIQVLFLTPLISTQSALHNLDLPMKESDYVFVSIVVRKLQGELRTLFQRKYGSRTSLPTLKNLIEFLEEHARCVENELSGVTTQAAHYSSRPTPSGRLAQLSQLAQPPRSVPRLPYQAHQDFHPITPPASRQDYRSPLSAQYSPTYSAQTSPNRQSPTRQKQQHYSAHAAQPALEKLVKDIPVVEEENHPTENVNDWLTSSENHISAPPITETQQSRQDILPPVQISTSEIQIQEASHSMFPKKVTHVEAVPYTEHISLRYKENIIGPMDVEAFKYVDNEFSNKHLRRSTRIKVKTGISREKRPTKSERASKLSNNSTLEKEKKLEKSKNSLTNFKIMKKEFCNLKKQSKNKLDVSIELCNKNEICKASSNGQRTANIESLVIDDTPNIPENKRRDKKINEQNIEDKRSTSDNKSSCIENAVNVTPAGQIIASSNNGMSEDPITDDDKIVMNKCTRKSNYEQKSKNENNKYRVELVIDKDRVNVSNMSISETEKREKNNIPFIKKNTFQPSTADEGTQNSDEDIHISITIREVVTNLTISNKAKEVQLKVNTDRVVQTTLEPTNIHETLIQPLNTKTVAVQTDSHNDISTLSQKYAVTKQPPDVLDKITSRSKNKASAATNTPQFLITESVEKELSEIMDHEEEMSKIEKVSESHRNQAPFKNSTKTNTINKKHDSNNVVAKATEKDIPDDLNLDDIYIFKSGSVKEHKVQMVKSSSKTPSEILLSTHKSSKSETLKFAEKRSSELDDYAESFSKRHKRQTSETEKNIINDNEVSVQEQNKISDSPDYDELTGQVFCNIVADIEQSQKLQITDKKTTTQAFNKTKEKSQNAQEYTRPVDEFAGENYSENMVFAAENMLGEGNTNVPGPETQQNIAHLLTLGMCSELADPGQDMSNETEPRVDIHRQDIEDVVVLCTPMDEDDSDKSVFEETPQKNVSIQKNRNVTINSRTSNNKKFQLVEPKVHVPKTSTAAVKEKSLASQESCSIINLTDPVKESTSKKGDAKGNPTNHKQSLETPLTINRFVNSIRHNSTPVVKKSLNFSKNNDTNPDEEDITLCLMEDTLIAESTQDKQFSKDQLENSPDSPARRPLAAKNVTEEANKKFVIAGSCLSSADLLNLKMLCFKRKWTYVDTYRPDLTHLVVMVDHENRTQRSVKYVCALAAGKWIVSPRWVEQCLETNTTVDEEPYEVLDMTGEAGPRRSRLADSKIFKGFTFCCMPPFSMLDLNTLMSLLQAAGARVVKEPREVKVTSNEPCLLLCEPENTEEDRYINLATQLGVVPVDYEWALNCLCEYALCSLYNLLLCPAAMLPELVQHWPPQLTQRNDNTLLR